LYASAQKKVISFPRNLDQLEQKKLEHDIECQHMKQTQLAAIMEMESAKVRKKGFQLIKIEPPAKSTLYA